MKLKALVLVAVAAVSMVFVAGCSDSPSEVVENFADAMADADLEEAKEYTTGSARKEIIGMLEGLEQAPASMKEKLLEEVKKEMGSKMSNIEVVSEDIDGENATVKVKVTVIQEEKVSLKKVDGDWKIEKL